MSVAVFFDLGDTLVIPRLSDDGSLLGLNVLPFVPDVLAKLRRTKTNDAVLRLGVISNTGTETLSKMRWLIAEAGLLDFFDPALLLFSSVEGIDKRQQQFFELASQRAGVPAEHCVYVSEDDAERRVAALAKLRTSYHPLHVFHVIDLTAQGLTGSASTISADRCRWRE
jgi:FMN phosphatase YigB (HAD superfamily)